MLHGTLVGCSACPRYSVSEADGTPFMITGAGGKEHEVCSLTLKASARNNTHHTCSCYAGKVSHVATPAFRGGGGGEVQPYRLP